MPDQVHSSTQPRPAYEELRYKTHHYRSICSCHILLPAMSRCNLYSTNVMINWGLVCRRQGDNSREIAFCRKWEGIRLRCSEQHYRQISPFILQELCATHVAFTDIKDYILSNVWLISMFYVNVNIRATKPGVLRDVHRAIIINNGIFRFYKTSIIFLYYETSIMNSYLVLKIEM